MKKLVMAGICLLLAGALTASVLRLVQKSTPAAGIEFHRNAPADERDGRQAPAREEGDAEPLLPTRPPGFGEADQDYADLEMCWDDNGGRTPRTERLAELIYDGLAFTLGETEAEIVSNLGEPLERIDQTQPCIHDPDETNTFRELKYDGLSVHMFIRYDGYEVPEGIRISSPRYGVKHGLGIGADADDVREKLGEPASVEGSYLVYRWNNPVGQDILVFEVSNRKVTSITWQYYLD